MLGGDGGGLNGFVGISNIGFILGTLLKVFVIKLHKKHGVDKSSNISHLRVFGCIAYSHVPSELRKKLDGKDNPLRRKKASTDQGSAIGDAKKQTKTQLKAFGEPMQQTIATQLDLVFKRLGEWEADKRLCPVREEVRYAHDRVGKLDPGEGPPLQQERGGSLQGPRGRAVSRCSPRGRRCPTQLLPPATDARQVDNFLWDLERYFEGLDINDKEEKVQTATMYLTNTAALWWRRRHTDRCDINRWEEFKRELKRQFYSKSVEDLATINLRRLKQKGSIRECVKEYSTLMPEIPKMSERQRFCFFINGLQQWIDTKLRRRKPHDLALAMAIVERLQSSGTRGQSLQGTTMPKVGETKGNMVARLRQQMMS
ncbi:hypothetical protein RJ639_047555 [Escallonia herrerae]|uniref:Retrotransposon gag domain-containing protein n=1 Tax=Escallonia herrerae TaxID=1293975 RepID=A0AA89B2F8_9ASTE|nr:hypothetical protein RJ639_047555 [Escallonia herrerae]